MKYKLLKPIHINGELTSEIDYDFDSITGNDINTISKELASAGRVVTVQETDVDFHVALFASAAGLSFADLKLLSAKDYLKVSRLVRDDFFLEDISTPEK